MALRIGAVTLSVSRSRSIARSHFFYAFELAVYVSFIPSRECSLVMADFLAVVGLVVFVAAMLGLIWGLDHV